MGCFADFSMSRSGFARIALFDCDVGFITFGPTKVVLFRDPLIWTRRASRKDYSLTRYSTSARFPSHNVTESSRLSQNALPKSLTTLSTPLPCTRSLMSSLSLSSFSTSSYPLHLEPVSPTTPSPLLNIITVYHVEPQLPDASTLAISPSDLQKRADIP
ncbi:hypothetical protein EYC84_003132 [Monilinia fructicola]|uniref:Uncharacterized protein n=1 Tax=Monilinia fructicola TaxID=38448 RepID=A0A5M9JV76_MONFR|nr:hypothetical protein EYC84_003132 [Monilinia fructicola]